jgi:hypothetical protein
VSATEFELEGRRFTVERLKVDDACLSLEVLGRALGPAAVAALGGGSPDYGAILSALLANASHISTLLKIFAPRSKFDRGINGTMVDLKPFLDEVFAGRVDLMIAFLVHAVKAEHGCFLGGPNALGQLLEQLVGKPSASQPGPTG